MRKLVLLAGAFLLLTSPAVAQTTSTNPPPSSTTTTTAAEDDEVVTQDIGDLDEGDSRTIISCGFGPPDVTVIFNDTNLVDSSDEVNSQGCASQILTIIEDGQPDEAALGTGRLVAAVGGARLLAQANNPAIVEIDGKQFVARKAGDNVLENIGNDNDGDGELTVRTLFSIGDETDLGDGRVGRIVRTGANVLRWSLPAIALLGIGALLVLAARRRKSTI